MIAKNKREIIGQSQITTFVTLNPHCRPTSATRSRKGLERPGGSEPNASSGPRIGITGLDVRIVCR
jgi:hypothetical protein